MNIIFILQLAGYSTRYVYQVLLQKYGDYKRQWLESLLHLYQFPFYAGCSFCFPYGAVCEYGLVFNTYPSSQRFLQTVKVFFNGYFAGKPESTVFNSFYFGTVE